MTSLKQMAVLCWEFLTLDGLTGHPAIAMCMANMQLPYFHSVPCWLSWCLSICNVMQPGQMVVKMMKSLTKNLLPTLRAQRAACLACLWPSHLPWETRLFRGCNISPWCSFTVSTMPLTYLDHHTFVRYLTKLERKHFENLVSKMLTWKHVFLIQRSSIIDTQT